MSGATSRRRGHQFERAIAQYLRDNGWQAITSRQAEGGRQEGADIVTDFPVSVEAKSAKTLDLSGWLRQAKDAAAGDPACVFVKRRGVGDVGRCYVVFEADDLLLLVASLVGEGDVAA